MAALLLPVSLFAQEQRVPEAFQLGLGLQQRGLHEEAAGQFASFLQSQGRHALAPEAGYRLAVSLLELDRGKDAVAALQLALQRGGDAFGLRHEARYRLASALQAGGDHAAAASEYERLLQTLPREHYLCAAVHYGHGECLRDGGGDAAALTAFAAAAEAARGDAAAFAFPARYQGGFAALRLGQSERAMQEFGAAVAAAPDAVAKHECEFLAGDAALRAGALDDAERWLQAAARGVGGGPSADGDFVDDAELALGFVAIARGDRDAALQRFERLVERRTDSPLRPRAQLEVGRLCYQRQDHQKAERVLRPLEQHGDPAIAQPARELLGLCALATGRGENAIEPLRQALAAATAAEQPRLSFALAEALAEVGQYVEALPHYERAQQAQDQALRGDALYGACFALHQLGRYDDSIAAAQRLRKELPQHRLLALATFACGENLFQLQRYQDAQREYEAVPDGSEPRAKAGFKLAWCRYLLGDKKGAAERFLAVAGQADHPHAEEALSMAALSLLENKDDDRALATADAYRARFPKGLYLDRTERVAARVLRARGDLVAAAERLGRASQSAQDGDADRLEQAEVQFQRGDFAAAAAIYGPLCEREDALGARAIEGAAWCAFELGDDDACAQRLQRGLGHPQAATVEPALLELQSALHHRREDWPAAIATAQQFLKAHGDHPKAKALRYALGVAQARKGDLPAARATLQQLLEQGGHDRMDRVAYELAWVCRRAGDEPAALRAFAAVADGSRDEDLAGEARLHLGTAALTAGDVSGARKLLTAVQGRYRGRALYQLGFADLEGSAEQPARLRQAEQAFAAVAAIDGEELAPEALFLVGECRRRADDAKGAAAAFAAVLERAPKHERAAMARLCLAEAAVALGDGDTAVEQSQQFLGTRPEDRTEQARAQLALGRGRQLRGEHERAEAPLQQVTQLTDGQLAAEAQFRLGECRQQRGDLQGAVDAFVKLPILYAHADWVARGLLQAGRCCEQLEQPDKARRFYQELVQRFPERPEAAAAKTRLDDKQ
ncbi:MAG: tetratricopeptide repeat protein [Planctomycetota bacterium]